MRQRQPLTPTLIPSIPTTSINNVIKLGDTAVVQKNLRCAFQCIYRSNSWLVHINRNEVATPAVSKTENIKVLPLVQNLLQILRNTKRAKVLRVLSNRL